MYEITQNFFHETRYWRILPSSGLLRSVGWLSTDVSGQPVGPIFKGPIGCPETSVLKQPTLRNNPEDGKFG